MVTILFKISFFNSNFKIANQYIYAYIHTLKQAPYVLGNISKHILGFKPKIYPKEVVF